MEQDVEKIYQDWFKNEDGEYFCECGRKFKNVNSFRSHRRTCKFHDNVNSTEYKLKHGYIKNNTDKYFDGNFYTCECGKHFQSKMSIACHFKYCEEHMRSIGCEDKCIKITREHFFKNKTEDEIKEIYKRSKETKRKRIESGELVIKGHRCSEETKEKLRNIFIQKHMNNKFNSNYSEKACKYIDELNKKMGWNLQHAMNGGEKTICGFFVDGYDEKRNIVFEYDEKKHYADVKRSLLKSKDLQRQFIIMEETGCKFFRYNEYTDYFYEVKNNNNFYLYVEDAIKDNKIDYTSRKTIKESLANIGITVKVYDSYVKKHPECGAVIYPSRYYTDEYFNLSDDEKKLYVKKLKEEKEKEKLQHLNDMNMFYKNICDAVRSILDKVDLKKWNRTSQIRKLIYPMVGDINKNKLKRILKQNDIELHDMIFYRDNLGSSFQKWIHNPLTNEVKRVSINELNNYVGWKPGRK